MEILVIIFIIFLIGFIYLYEKNQPKSNNIQELTTNVLILPNLEELSCDNCGNKNINILRDLDTFTFDIKCKKCKSIIWKNPNRESRIKQMDSFLEF